MRMMKPLLNGKTFAMDRVMDFEKVALGSIKKIKIFHDHGSSNGHGGMGMMGSGGGGRHGMMGNDHGGMGMMGGGHRSVAETRDDQVSAAWSGMGGMMMAGYDGYGSPNPSTWPAIPNHRTQQGRRHKAPITTQSRTALSIRDGKIPCW